MPKKLEIFNAEEDEGIKEVLEERGKCWGITYKRIVKTLKSQMGNFKSIMYYVYDKEGNLMSIFSHEYEARGFFEGLFCGINHGGAHLNSVEEYLKLYTGKDKETVNG